MYLQVTVNFEDGSDKELECAIASLDSLGGMVPIMLEQEGIEEYSSLQIIVVANADTADLKSPVVAEYDPMERIGQFADKLDAALHAQKIPGIPDDIHVKGMSGVIREVRDGIAEVVRDQTGEDPWASNPFTG